jgi:L-iditol 2-dehydrogenase
VTVLPSSAVVCGKCEYCRQGYYMFCPIRRGMGHGVNGSFTRFAAVREDQCYRLSESVSFEEGAMAEPFAAALQAVGELSACSVGDSVLLSGPGPIGLLCLMVLASQGCRVIVAGTSQDGSRLEMAKALGAVAVVDVTREDLAEVVARETGGRGVDAAVEVAGAAASVAACLASLRQLGKYFQVGIVGKPITVDFDTILFKQIQVFGSVGHSLRTWEGVMRIIRSRSIDLTRIITHKLPLSRWREGFELCETKKGVKVMLYYDDAVVDGWLGER